MITIPASAFAMFRTEHVVIHADQVGADGVRERAVLAVPASVSDEGERRSPIGDLVDAHLVTVEIAVEDWTQPVPITKGSWIEPDPKGRWRKLVVREAAIVGQLYHLTCSAKEGPGNGKA
ncbi:MAG: hypothetical protein IJ678_06480 [Kiritimatiellae bacterium]|nr:hypothetical protein [Kiritimatiellia bacterium]